MAGPGLRCPGIHRLVGYGFRSEQAMSIAFSKSSAFSDTTTTGTSLVCTYSVNIGDLVYVSLSVNANNLIGPTVIDNGPNTYTQQVAYGARLPTHVVFTTIATVAASTITVGYPAGAVHLVMISTYTNVSAIGPNKTATALISPTNTTPPSLTVTLAAPNNWGLINFTYASVTLTSVAGGVTLRNTGQSTLTVRCTVMDVTNATSFSISGVFSSSTNWTLSYIEIVPTALSPILNSISPNTVSVVNPTFTVTFHGTNLTGTTTVNVGGASILVSNISVISDSTVTANFSIPQNASIGTFNISLTTPNGTSNTLPFTLTLRPAGQAIFYDRVASQWAFKQRRRR